jgi:hypothetical protein
VGTWPEFAHRACHPAGQPLHDARTIDTGEMVLSILVGSNGMAAISCRSVLTVTQPLDRAAAR